MSTIKEWELVDSRIDRDYRVFKVGVNRACSPRTNKSSEFYTVETQDWVNVIALTEGNDVVMIRQYRHGSREVTLEIPGGLVEQEHPEKAALRELLEETGYSGEEVTYLGATNPNPALFNNLCHTYLVSGARKVSEKNLDPDEDIEVILMPLTEVPELIRKGSISHALVIVAFHFYFMKESARL